MNLKMLPLLILSGIHVAPSALLAQAATMERDVVYGHMDGMAMVYDVSRPSQGNGAGVIFIVSGGFVSSVESQAALAPVVEPLLSAGVTIFHLRHPSTPRYLAPEIYEALKLGTNHILGNAARFGVDPARVGVMGVSTGGMLALLLGMDADEASPARPQAVVAYMPPVDMREHVGNVQATPSLGFPAGLAPALSPVDHVRPDNPPILFIHGATDTVVPVDNSVRLNLLLTEAGVESAVTVVEAGHQLFEGPAKETADRAAIDWFRKHLRW